MYFLNNEDIGDEPRHCYDAASLLAMHRRHHGTALCRSRGSICLQYLSPTITNRVLRTMVLSS